MESATRQRVAKTQALIKVSAHVMLFTMLAGSFVSSTAQSMLAAALPQIMLEFSVNATLGQLLTTGYVYTLGIMSAMTAFLLARCNTRYLFLAALACFIVGCIGAFFSTHYWVLLASRFLQACGNGILMPLLQMVAVTIYPRNRRGFALGLVGMVIAFAPVIGPTLSGFICDMWGWRMIFIVLGSAAFASWLIAFAVVSDICNHEPSRFDVRGCVLFTTGLIALMTGATLAEQVGIMDVRCIIGLVGAALCLCAFVLRQIKSADPLLNLRLLQRKNVWLGVTLVAVAQMSMVVGTVQAPLYIQEVHQLPALESGLLLLPGSLLTALISAPVGTFYDKHGMRVSAMLGLAIMFVGTLGFVGLDERSSIIFIMTTYAARMVGLTFLMMPMTAYALEKLEGNNAAHGTAIVNTVRQICGSLGTSILVFVTAQVTFVYDAHASSAASGVSAIGIHASFGAQAVLFLMSFILVAIVVKPKQGFTSFVAHELEHALVNVEETFNPRDSMR